MSILLRELTDGLETCEEIVRRDSFDFSEDDKGQLLSKLSEVKNMLKEIRQRRGI